MNDFINFSVAVLLWVWAIEAVAMTIILGWIIFPIHTARKNLTNFLKFLYAVVNGKTNDKL